MGEEKKELQKQDTENVSGGLSLEGAKKWAKRHEKGLKVAGAAAGTALIATGVEELGFKGKHRKALFGKNDEEGINISKPKNFRQMGQNGLPINEEDYTDTEGTELEPIVKSNDSEKNQLGGYRTFS